MNANQEIDENSTSVPFAIEWYKSHKASCRSCKDMELNLCDRLTPSQTYGEIDRTDWKLNPKYLNEVMKRHKLILPTIDCFASDMNRQAFALYITKDQDFFSKIYNCTVFWRMLVLWSNPPYHQNDQSLIIKTIEMYEERGIRGYLCVPKWEQKPYYQLAQKLCQNQITIPTKYKKDAYFPASTGNKKPIGPCIWDTELFFFDFRERA